MTPGSCTARWTPSADPGHISYKYTKPPEGAPGETPILDLHYRVAFQFGNVPRQSQDGHLVINLDGRRNPLSRQGPSGGYGGGRPGYGGGPGRFSRTCP